MSIGFLSRRVAEHAVFYVFGFSVNNQVPIFLSAIRKVCFRCELLQFFGGKAGYWFYSNPLLVAWQTWNESGLLFFLCYTGVAAGCIQPPQPLVNSLGREFLLCLCNTVGFHAAPV